MLLLREKEIKLCNKYGGSKFVPTHEYAKTFGVSSDQFTSREQLLNIIDNMCRLESSLDKQTTDTTIASDGSEHGTGQVHQKIRDNIRDRLLAPYQDSGLIERD